MIDPIPPYDSICSKEDATAILLEFRNRVVDTAAKYKIRFGNRFLCMMDACHWLEYRLKQKDKIWAIENNVACSDIEDVMQILLYAICDSHLLFDTWGNLLNTPDFEEWKDSAYAYRTFAFALRNRHIAYNEIMQIRRYLDAHANQRSHFDEYCTNSSTSFLDFVEQYIIRSEITFPTHELHSTLESLTTDPVLRSAAPLYLLFAYKAHSEKATYSPDTFKAYLKYKSTAYKQSQPHEIAESLNLCKVFQVFSDAFDLAFCEDSSNFIPRHHRQIFDSYRLLVQLRMLHNIPISDIEIAKISHICLCSRITPSCKKELEQFRTSVNGIPIGKIIKALLVVFDAQYYQIDKPQGYRPKELLSSLKTIYQAKLVETPLNISPLATSYTDKEYEQIRQAVLRKFVTIPYDFNSEAFWLITGYYPPPGFCFSRDSFDLYSLCNDHLEASFERLDDAFCSIDTQAFQTAALRKDILKVHTDISINWNRACNEEQFFNSFRTVSEKNCATHKKPKSDSISGNLRVPNNTEEFFSAIYHSVCLSDCDSEIDKSIQYCCEQIYTQITGVSIPYKSSSYAYETLINEIVNECLIQAKIELNKIVFSFFANLNKTLWPT